MKGVKYIGAVWDRSGYAEACRNYILSIHKAGIPITVQAISFENNPPPLENLELSMQLQNLCARDIDYDIVIIHTTPLS